MYTFYQYGIHLIYVCTSTKRKDYYNMFSDFVSFCILIKHYRIKHVVYRSWFINWDLGIWFTSFNDYQVWLNIQWCMRHRYHITVFTLLTRLVRSPQWETDLVIENILLSWEQNGEIYINRKKTSKQGLSLLFKIEIFHFLYHIGIGIFFSLWKHLMILDKIKAQYITLAFISFFKSLNFFT